MDVKVLRALAVDELRVLYRQPMDSFEPKMW